jgi:hypothetical protein
MLPFENAKLLPKSKVFEEQVAARAKEASGHDRQKPQQAHHETSFTRVHAKAGTQPTYLIRQQIAILASHSHRLRTEEDSSAYPGRAHCSTKQTSHPSCSQSTSRRY